MGTCPFLFKIHYGLRAIFWGKTKNIHLFVFVFFVLIRLCSKNLSFCVFHSFLFVLFCFISFGLFFGWLSWVTTIGSTRSSWPSPPKKKRKEKKRNIYIYIYIIKKKQVKKTPLNTLYCFFYFLVIFPLLEKFLLNLNFF